MNRKVVGGQIAVVILAVVALLFWLGYRDDTQADRGNNGKARSAEIANPTARTPGADDPKPAPRGMAPRWMLDTDPQGPLRLEGQVQGPDGKGIGGAEVMLGSVP